MPRSPAHSSAAKRRRLGLIVAVGSSLLYGIYPACVRAVYDDGGNIVFMLMATTWARAIGLTLCAVLQKQKLFPTKTDRREALKGGLLQALSAVGVASALAFLPGPLVIITVFSHTLMLLFFLAWKKEIKLDSVTVLTTVIALGGLSLVLDLWHHQSVQHLWGIGLAFFAALVVVLRMYVYEQQMTGRAGGRAANAAKARAPAAIGAENFLVAAAATLLAMFYQLPQLPAAHVTLWWVVLAGVTMAIGSVGSFFGIYYLGAFRFSLFAKLEPVFTAVFSALLIGEVLKPTQYVGVVVVLGSLAIYQTVDARRLKRLNEL